MNIFRQVFQLIVPTGSFCWYSSLAPDELLAHIRNSHAPAPPNTSSIPTMFLAFEPYFLTSVAGSRFTVEAAQNSSTKLYFTGTVSEYGGGSMLQGTFINKGDRLFSAIGYIVIAFAYLWTVVTSPHFVKSYPANLLGIGLLYLLLGLCLPRMRFHSSKRALLQPVKDLLTIQEEPSRIISSLSAKPR